MLEELLNAYGSRLLIAVVGVGLAFALLIVALRFMRGRSGPSPFIRGGKNRQPRLQVLDAAAVDTRRRLVLVRRDNVEHLIMIGGPTDIVVESGISTSHLGREVGQPAAGPRPLPSEQTPTVSALDVERRQQQPIDTRPAAPQRVAPTVAGPELRAEPARETVFAPEPTRPARPVPAPPKPAVNLAAEVPVPAPVQVPKVEPAVRPAPEVRSEPLRPIAALAAASATAGSQGNTAAAVLDSARDRVFQPAPETRAIAPVTSSPVPPALQVAAEAPRQLGNDFERILEQEMASNLAAREAAATGQQNRQLPPRDPAAPKVTGATPEPTLQNEVARIFGEMSVTRDK